MKLDKISLQKIKRALRESARPKDPLISLIYTLRTKAIVYLQRTLYRSVHAASYQLCSVVLDGHALLVFSARSVSYTPFASSSTVFIELQGKGFGGDVFISFRDVYSKALIKEYSRISLSAVLLVVFFFLFYNQ